MTLTKSQNQCSAAASDDAKPGPARVNAYVRNALQNEARMIKEAWISNPEECPPCMSSFESIPHSVLQLANTEVKSALIAYLTTARLAKDIAREHGFTGGVLSYWARKLGLPLRRRGRRALLQPTSAQQRIVELVRAHGISETARRVGISRQWVHKICKRWAPDINVHPKAPKFMARPRYEQRRPRTVVVSFRISNEEWLRLSAESKVTSMGHGLSPHARARDIVLNFIEPRSRCGQGPMAKRERA